MKYQIVADSSSNLTGLEGANFASVPLRIVTKEREYVDDEHLDVREMVTELKAYKGRSTTACPGVGDWLHAFGDADVVLGVALTSNLSGSWNAARLAKQAYETAHPERRVFILDTLSAGPELQLIIEKFRVLIEEGKTAEQIEWEAIAYWNHTHLLFSLESLTNLSRNGRVNPVVAAAAGVLGIRVVGRASERGDLETLEKCRGEKKSIETLYRHLLEMGYEGGKVRIAHCFNPIGAGELASRIYSAFPGSDVRLLPCRGLCSFYAEKGGLMVGFEDGRPSD